MTSDLVDRLINNLNSDNIEYCHWKSNISLAQAVSGDVDLDLFIDRKSLQRALSTLWNLGYKLAVVKRGPATPGISHYYGFDSQLGQLSHVHLFSRVLTGESFLKSHLLPFEEMLLEDNEHIGEVRVVSKPAELILFILRTFVKYGSLLDLVRLHRKSEEIKAELRWLQIHADISECIRLLRKYCPVIDETLFYKCINSLDANGSLGARIILARRLRRRLRIYAKNSSINRVLAYLQMFLSQVRLRLAGNRKNKILQSGGSVVAFVGPDAVGKSSLISECASWLGDALAVRALHAGRPPSSCLTAPLNMILCLARRFSIYSLDSRPNKQLSQTKPSQSRFKRFFYLYIYALRSLSLAWDRRQLLVKARRLAANGEIIICDRYPSDAVGAMDSRRLQEIWGDGGLVAAIYNWMARLEAHIYNQIPPPDIAIRLTVSMETAKRRHHERIKVGKGQVEEEAVLESRHLDNPKWHLPGTKCICDIDTERSLSETLISAKKAIWEWL